MIPRSGYRWLQGGLVLTGLLLLASWSGGYLESRGYQADETRKFDLAMRGSGPQDTGIHPAGYIGPIASRPRPRPRAVAANGVIGRLEVPRLGISAIVAEGADLKTLKRAVGHIKTTALPGNAGNCALAGHRDSFLRGLGAVQVNDVIRLATLDHTYLYRVVWTEVVDPHRIDVLNATPDRSLTLITCFPFEFVGHAPKRFIVRATQVEAVANRSGAD